MYYFNIIIARHLKAMIQATKIKDCFSIDLAEIHPQFPVTVDSPFSFAILLQHEELKVRSIRASV